MNTPDCYKFNTMPKVYEPAAIRSDVLLSGDQHNLKICLMILLLEKLAALKFRNRISCILAYLCRKGEIRRVGRGVYEKFTL